MSQHERATYAQGREIMNHAVAYQERVRDALDELQQNPRLPERTRLLLTSVALDQRNLLGALERYREDATLKTREYYAQYLIELPPVIGQPDSPVASLELMQWLQGLYQPLCRMFEDLAGKGDSPELAEVFGALAELVRGHERRLSKEYQRSEDL
jgi:hypothetical protein